MFCILRPGLLEMLEDERAVWRSQDRVVESANSEGFCAAYLDVFVKVFDIFSFIAHFSKAVD